MNFEEWYLDNREDAARDVLLGAFEAGAQSQQAKIDAITKQRDSFIKAHHIAMNDVCENKAKIEELQARIDKTVNHIEEWYGCVELSNIVDILKGNKDEN